MMCKVEKQIEIVFGSVSPRICALVFVYEAGVRSSGTNSQRAYVMLSFRCEEGATKVV